MTGLMEPKIAESGMRTLVGMVSCGGSICELWDQFSPNEELIPHRVDGAWYEYHAYPKDHKPGDPFYVMAAVEVTEIGSLPECMFVKVLPAGTYAVFEYHLSIGGYDVINSAIREWLDSGPYRMVGNCSLQIYDSRYKGHDDPESVLDLVVQVEPKQ